MGLTVYTLLEDLCAPFFWNLRQGVDVKRNRTGYPRDAAEIFADRVGVHTEDFCGLCRGQISLLKRVIELFCGHCLSLSPFVVRETFTCVAHAHPLAVAG